jgi:hypothetical protein
LFCGSSAVIAGSILKIPKYADADNLKSILFNQVSHMAMAKFLLDNGVKYHVPDKNLVVYVRDNGENISAGKHRFTYILKRFAKMMIRWSYLSKNEKKAFQL